MTRLLQEIAVLPGPEGVLALHSALGAAFDGGAAVAPVPISADGSTTDYGRRIRSALRPDDATAALEREDVVAVVSTSGSTGDPKGVLLTDSGIRAAAHGIHSVLGGPGDWVVAMPVHGVGGLMVLARSLLSNNAIHLDPSVGGAQSFDSAVFVRTVSQARATAGSTRLYCSLVPTQLQRVVDGGAHGLDALRELDAILVGAAAAPAHLMKVLRDNRIRVHESYGMSETCGGCAFDGVPLPGVRIATDAPDSRGLGRIVVTAPQVAAGYRLRPSPDLQDGRILTTDAGTVATDGRVRIVGRIDDIVTVGGSNVSLPAVAETLRTVAGIRDACVIDVPDPTWGSRLVAYVITDDGANGSTGTTDELTDRAQAAVRSQLGRAAAPRTYVIDKDASALLGNGIPLLPTGKPDRARLRAAAASSG